MFSTHCKWRLFARLAAMFMLVLPGAVQSSTVRMETTLGVIEVLLYDNAAPRTVANFLQYVNSGAFNNSFVHRSVPGFIIQGGGFVWNDAAGNMSSLPTNGPVANEFSTTRSNLRGTIAMAKLSGDPNSATSQWFFNLANNAASLDVQNGGFTVFGEVSPASMSVIDAIANLPRINAGSPFDELPLVSTPTNGTIQKANLAIISTATVAPVDYQGLWWNANESGWGMSLTQHGNIIFAALYTYDNAGQPTWYVIPNCPVVSSGCSGDIYKVTGGTPPTAAWNGTGKNVAKVGNGTLAFANTSAGIFNFTIDNVAGSKAITQQVFATGSVPPVNYTDLWWNSNESGWGISLTQQFGIIFAAWYTYDATGKPVWYVVPNCLLSGAGCTGSLYLVTGGQPLTAKWNYTNPATNVGSVSFAFSNTANGTMSYTINGISSSRVITRQAF